MNTLSIILSKFFIISGLANSIPMYGGKDTIEGQELSRHDKVVMKPFKSASQAEGRGFETPFPLKGSYRLPVSGCRIPLTGLEPPKGVEPSTCSLRVSCSTTELRRQKKSLRI
jgi:hypothetical protein